MEGTQRITDDLDRLCRVAASSNHAMHRMPNPPLCFGFVTGDGGRYVVPSMLHSRVLNHV